MQSPLRKNWPHLRLSTTSNWRLKKEFIPGMEANCWENVEDVCVRSAELIMTRLRPFYAFRDVVQELIYATAIILLAWWPWNFWLLVALIATRSPHHPADSRHDRDRR